ncbi:MAG: hypothetical protein Q4E83_05060 [bacterium]|nr:hypothetical protein [bacterium]
MRILANKTEHSEVVKRRNVRFLAAPWILNLGHLEYAEKISGKEAIDIFEKFKLGNYLDLDGGKESLFNSRIRNNNLSFLDKLKNISDKKEFIDYYKQLTGFPSLENVAYKIKKEFQYAVDRTEKLLKSKYDNYKQKYFDILHVGYDGVSSVAKKKALPGSDLDKAFVIIRGDGESYESNESNEKLVNEFKAQLWKNTDQRILSYNHDADSFPKVYTDIQVKSLINEIEYKMFIDKISIASKIFPPFAIAETFAKVLFTPTHPSTTYNNDYIAANSFFIKLCKNFPKKGNWNLDLQNPSRENIYNFGFILEALKWGEDLKTSYDTYVNSSMAANLINVSQIYSLKNSQGYKSKYAQREKLAREFNNWSIDKQLKLIKSLILNSCGEESSDFPEYFTSSESNKFESLMRAVGL